MMRPARLAMAVATLLAAPGAGMHCAAVAAQLRAPRAIAASDAASGSAADSSRSWCAREPRGWLEAFVEDAGDSPVSSFRGTVTELLPADASGFERAKILAAAGRARTLKFKAPGVKLPLSAGTAYEFRVEFEGESPHTCALVVSDRRGVCLIAATDVRPGATVLKDGSGFRASLGPRVCASRPHSECFEAIYNLELKIARGKSSVRLHTGESARLGAWRVHCFVAQEPVYSPKCADAGVPGVSYLIVREH